ncbi:MAG: helix-turn-helix domain-containing protein [Clostridia bacterium]|nr:helix-turn-helix domain-containing protein [Clostridia bacterium]
MNDHLPLNDLLDLLSLSARVQICLYDAVGILLLPEMQISEKYRTHTARFCDLAKDTPRGYHLCVHCKTRANQKALEQGLPFSGYCPYGLYELAWPIRMEGQTVAVLYIGNLLPDPQEAEHRLGITAQLTGAPLSSLLSELQKAQIAPDLLPYQQMARAIDSYIRLLLTHLDWKNQRRMMTACQRKVREAIEYIHLNYRRDISLKQLAALYFINEKYLGQVFLKETGKTVRQYLNQIRLHHAAQLLKNTQDPILQIALDSGFQNIPYFTRQFSACFQMPPSVYRQQFSLPKQQKTDAP